MSGTQTSDVKRRVAGWVAGGGLAAVIFAGGPHCVSMFTEYLEHREEMARIERLVGDRQVAFYEAVTTCEDPIGEGGLGGKWYRGDCLVAFEEEVHP